MTEEEHRQHHVTLHKHFDLLIADYLRNHPRKLLSNTTMLELMKWSFEQTQKPDHKVSGG